MSRASTHFGSRRAGRSPQLPYTCFPFVVSGRVLTTLNARRYVFVDLSLFSGFGLINFAMTMVQHHPGPSVKGCA